MVIVMRSRIRMILRTPYAPIKVCVKKKLKKMSRQPFDDKSHAVHYKRVHPGERYLAAH